MLGCLMWDLFFEGKIKKRENRMRWQSEEREINAWICKQWMRASWCSELNVKPSIGDRPWYDLSRKWQAQVSVITLYVSWPQKQWSLTRKVEMMNKRQKYVFVFEGATATFFLFNKKLRVTTYKCAMNKRLESTYTVQQSPTPVTIC